MWLETVILPGGGLKRKKSSSAFVKALFWRYFSSEILCIALCVLHILGFSVPSIILADLLGNALLLARVQKVVVCGSGLVDFDPFYLFRLSRFVAVWSSCYGQNRLDKFTSHIYKIFFKILFVSFTLYYLHINHINTLFHCYYTLIT